MAIVATMAAPAPLRPATEEEIASARVSLPSLRRVFVQRRVNNMIDVIVAYQRISGGEYDEMLHHHTYAQHERFTRLCKCAAKDLGFLQSKAKRQCLRELVIKMSERERNQRCVPKCVCVCVVTRVVWARAAHDRPSLEMLWGSISE